MERTVSAQKTAKNNNKRRIFIVDDHPIVRQGLTQLIDNEPDLVVCGQGEDAYQALKLIRQAKPDLTLVDISLKDTGGIELLKELRAQDPNLQVLILSMHDESLYAERALRAGARGYVMKQAPQDQVMAAVRGTLAGETWLSEQMSAKLLRSLRGARTEANISPLDRLTDRELEIFRMIGQGLS